MDEVSCQPYVSIITSSQPPEGLLTLSADHVASTIPKSSSATPVRSASKRFLTLDGKFDRTAYQREYMRKYRASKRTKSS